MEQKKFSLPPHINGKTYGKLFIQIGKVHSLLYKGKNYIKNMKISNIKFKIKFWGSEKEIYLR